MTVRVLLAEDQTMFRSALATLLALEPDIEVVAEVDRGDRIASAVRQWNPDVALMDIEMPGIDGLEAARRLRAEGCPVKVVIVTTFGRPGYLHAAMEAGAAGFLLKDADADRLVEAVRLVAGGDGLIAPEVTRRLIAEFASTRPAAGGPVAPTPTVADLTPREREVLACLGLGLSNMEIADRLGVGETTVKTHVSRVLAKLGLRSRVQAAIAARELAD
jgi:DNA-binding NarL/FixJ family response regulator